MRHPSNRGERKAAYDKSRRKAEATETYSGRHTEVTLPDFAPSSRRKF